MRHRPRSAALSALTSAPNRYVFFGRDFSMTLYMSSRDWKYEYMWQGMSCLACLTTRQERMKLAVARYRRAADLGILDLVAGPRGEVSGRRYAKDIDKDPQESD